ncbi:MAG TPA: hypothetical protein VHX16_01710, partial [Chloroflexota bacterium]|nr:hypothetical protein [Chloroflexota bacterium]
MRPQAETAAIDPRVAAAARPVWRVTASAKLRGFVCDLLALTCLALLIGYVLFEPLIAGRLIIGNDMDQPYNWESFNRQAFALRQLPLWNPYVFSGFPAQADIQTGVFYPPYWLLRPLQLELGTFFMWSLAAHLWLLGAGTYALCRQIGVSRPAALAGGLGLMLGGIAVPRIFAGHLLLLYGFCWMPLITALALRSLQAPRLMPQPLLVLALLAQLLAGATQPVAYTLALIALVAFLQPAWPVSQARGRLGRLAPLGQLALLAVLFVGLSAFQTLPLLRLMAEAGRGEGLSYEQATKGSIYPPHLWTILFPNAFADYGTRFSDGLPGSLWEKCPYVGFLLAAAAPLAVASRDRRYVLLFTLVAVISLAFALGENLPAYYIHYLVLPGFRIPSRLLSVFALATAVLGAMGLDALTSRSARGRVLNAAVATYVLAAAVGVLTVLVMQPNVRAADDIATRPLLSGVDSRLLAVQGFGLLAVLLISRLARQGSAALLLAGALIALDVSAFAAQFLTISGPGTDVEARDTLAPVRAGRVLSLCQQSITPNSMIGLRVPTVDGYNSAFLRRYADFASLVQGGEIGESHAAFPKIGTAGSLRRPKLVDALNVTHIHSCSELDDRFPVVATTSTWKLYENPGALPRAYLVCQAERVTTPNRAARSMRDSKFDPSRQAVIIASDPGAA